jgi:hypothetical protein
MEDGMLVGKVNRHSPSGVATDVKIAGIWPLGKHFSALGGLCGRAGCWNSGDQSAKPP